MKTKIIDNNKKASIGSHVIKGYLTNLSLAVGGGWTAESWVLIFAAYSIDVFPCGL